MQAVVEKPKSCQAVSMGYKEDLQRVHAKIDSTFRDLSARPAPVSGWQKAGPIMAACSFLLAGFVAYTVHSAGDMKTQVTLEVASQLKDPTAKIGTISSDIAEMKGKLEVLDPLIRGLATKHLSEAVSLNLKELLARLPELQATVLSAKQGGIKIQPDVIKQLGMKLVDVGGQNVSSWNAAMDFLAYRSFINLEFVPPPFWGTLLPVTDYTIYSSPPTAGRMYNEGRAPIERAAVYAPFGMKTNINKKEGDARLVIIGGAVPLDGYEMRHITFRDAKITYSGGQTTMEDVLFINCTFDVIQQKSGQNFARSLLSSASSLDFVSA